MTDPPANLPDLGIASNHQTRALLNQMHSVAKAKHLLSMDGNCAIQSVNFVEFSMHTQNQYFVAPFSSGFLNRMHCGI
jgi:hypothetical protein